MKKIMNQGIGSLLYTVLVCMDTGMLSSRRVVTVRL